jgi:hypothetical protein
MAWMGPANGKRAKQHRSSVSELGLYQAVLSEEWKRLLSPGLGPVEAVVNPVGPKYTPGHNPRDANHILVLGRNDPVKGHAFAEEVVARLSENRPDIRLSMTGRKH